MGLDSSVLGAAAGHVLFGAIFRATMLFPSLGLCMCTCKFRVNSLEKKLSPSTSKFFLSTRYLDSTAMMLAKERVVLLLYHPMKQREAPHRYFQTSKVLGGEISLGTSDMVMGGDFSLVLPLERNDALQLVA